MREYLEKYPNDYQAIMALQYAYGFDEVDKICKRALLEYKMVKIVIDSNELDYIDYELIA
jgi:hypothetical protein